MRVTTTIKDYIYDEVKNKAAVALKVAAERRDEARKACDAAYKKLDGIVDEIVDDANKKVKSAINECGLSIRDVDLRIYESPPDHVPRLWYRNWMHRTLVRNQFRGRLRRNKWRGKRRFDVVMVLPQSGCVGRPSIDHIVDVKM